MNLPRGMAARGGEVSDELLRVIQGGLAGREAGPWRDSPRPWWRGKARIANPGRRKGKRGGYRCLYLYLEKKQHIHLLILLDKNEQEDASEEQRRQMRDWVAQIRKEPRS